MKQYIISVPVWLLLLAACGAKQEQQPASAAVPHAPDETAINQAVANAYKVICFEPGKPVDFTGMKRQFIPGATMLNFRNDTLERFTIEQFEATYRAMLASKAVTSFYEEELYGITEQFGRIAHRISTYRTYINTRDSAAEQGVNSFQLIKTADGWKVSSIIWDVENAGRKIPAYYMPVNTKNAP